MQTEIRKLLRSREKELLRWLMMKGLEDKEIALRMGLSCNSVRSYLTRMMKVTNTSNRVQLAVHGLKASRMKLKLTPREQARLNFLFPREKEVVRFVIQGLSNKEIAFKMGLQLKTVDSYMQHILSATVTWSRLELAIWGLKAGLE